MFLQWYMTQMYWIYLGEALHTKLQRIEKEQQKAVTMIGHSVLALHSQHEELKDSHFRLEKTQDQIHFELKEQIAILGEENEELDRKYQKSVDKYNIERTKSEQQEKYKVSIFHNVLLIYYQGKQIGYRCVKKNDSIKFFVSRELFFYWVLSLWSYITRIAGTFELALLSWRRYSIQLDILLSYKRTEKIHSWVIAKWSELS